MKRKIIFTVVIAILLFVVGYYIYSKEVKINENSSGNNFQTVKDPFEGIVIPAEFDEATRVIVQQNIDQTKAMYRESPGIWEAWIAIGNLKAMVKDYNGAIEAFRQSIALQYNNVQGYRNIAEVYRVNLQDYAKAEEYYRLAIENNLGDDELYVALAVLQHNQLNDMVKAENTYLKGLSATGNNPDLLVRLIRFYKTTGQQEKYEQRAKQLLELYPDNEAYQKEWGGLIDT